MNIRDRVTELVGDIIALGTDHSNNPPAPQNEDEATQAILDLMEQTCNEARIEEAKWWEYNIIPAVRNKQVAHDVDKRLKQLMGGK